MSISHTLLKRPTKLMLLLLFFAVAGCEYITGGTDNSEPPMALNNITPQKKFEQMWSVSTGGGDYAQYLKLKPLILEQEIVTVDGRGLLQARALATGKLLWETQLKKAVTAGVGGDSSKVVVGFSDGSLAAFNAKDGKSAWVKTLDKNILNIPTADSTNVYLQTTDGTLYALNKDSGNLNWENKNSVPDLTIYSTSSPTVWRDMVIAGFANGKVSAFSRQSGTPLWDYQIAVPEGTSSIQRMVDVNSSPKVIDGVLYAASYHGYMVALDLTTGVELWKTQLSTINNFSFSDHHLYVSDTEGTVWALNRMDGRILWQQKDLKMRDLSGTIYNNKTVMVGDFEGYIHGLAEDHGGFIARTKLSANGIRVAPEEKNGIIYVLDTRGVLSAYKIS